MLKFTPRLFSLGLLVAGAALCQTSFAAVNKGDKLYIDFGPGVGNADGAPMVSPDSNGLYWNNAILDSRPPGGTQPAPVNNLVTSNNVGTGVNLTFTNNWQMNGNSTGGGLQTPNSTLLGDFAQANATRDYMFLNAGDSGKSASMTFSNLNVNLAYDFKMFGTRDQTQVRITRYSITDANGVHTFDLQTSGPGIGAGGYNGNNNTFAYLNGIVPNASGQITLTISSATDNFAYIGAMQITAVPEPHEIGLAIALGCLALIVVRRHQLRRENA